MKFLYKTARHVKAYDRRSQGSLGKFFNGVEAVHILRMIDYEPVNLVELGAGTGRITNLIKKKHQSSKLIAIDKSFEMLKKAKLDMESKSDAFFLVADVSTDDLSVIRKIRAEYVVAIGILESFSVSQLEKIFKKIGAQMNHGGRFIFTVWNSNAWLKPRILQGRRPGSYAYSMEFLQDLTMRYGMYIKYVKSTFFIPRTLFWFLWNLASFVKSLEAYYLKIVSKAEIFFSSKFPLLGMELIICLERWEQNE